MIRKIVFSVFLIVGMLWARDIIIVADYWMPFNGDDVANEGYMIEIAQAVFADDSIQVQYRSLPWDKAIEKTRIGKYDGLIGAFKSDAPDFIFPSNDQGFGGNIFFALKNNSWRYTDTTSLSSIKIGVTKDYSYGETLDCYIRNHLNDSTRISVGSGKWAVKDNLMKLLFGKVDAILDNSSVIEYNARLTDKTDNIQRVGVAEKPQSIYIAFSPAKSDGKQLAEKLSKGMDRLRANGRLANILKKYGLTDWKQ